MQTDNLELKKLVYLYLMNYAKSQPDMAIMAVNTFVKVRGQGFVSWGHRGHHVPLHCAKLQIRERGQLSKASPFWKRASPSSRKLIEFVQ